jgi:hypothetical protein
MPSPERHPRDRPHGRQDKRREGESPGPRPLIVITGLDPVISRGTHIARGEMEGLAQAMTLRRWRKTMSARRRTWFGACGARHEDPPARARCPALERLGASSYPRVAPEDERRIFSSKVADPYADGSQGTGARHLRHAGEVNARPCQGETFDSDPITRW